MAAGRLGIIAGAGALPALVVRGCRARNENPYVIALDGQADADAFDRPADAWVPLGQPLKAFDLLRRAAVRDLLLIGAVRRPSLASMIPDLRAAAFLARVAIRMLGDDTVLRAVATEIETEGFNLVGIKTVAPEVLAPLGVLGRVPFPPELATAAVTGLADARHLGAADRGQAVVVADGVIIDREDNSGTDALIARNAAEPGRRFLVKCRKPQQDDRFDLPAIGVATIDAARQAGFAGIVIEAGETIIIDHQATAAAADAAELFVVGIRGVGP